ncbi:MAG: hypothetical protein ACUVQ0_02780 [Thermoproteota archaeon]
MLGCLINSMAEEWALLGPHEYLSKKADLDELEKKVYSILEKGGPMPVSKIWRLADCHLWELDAVLRRLRDRRIISEEY